MAVNPYAKTITPDELVIRHADLVKKIAYHLVSRLPPSVLVDDLIQSGMLGLLEAASHYDITKGAAFETFAGIRIRGAMLDEMRRGEWAPRSVHKNARAIADAIFKVESRTGRDAKDTEVAKEMGISLNEYHLQLSDVTNGKMIGFDDIGLGPELYDEGLSGKSETPDTDLEREHFQNELIDGISNLPERERLILALYYDEELNLKEIGEVLDVSESRVSQIHGQAMLRLRGRLKDWQN